MIESSFYNLRNFYSVSKETGEFYSYQLWVFVLSSTTLSIPIVSDIFDTLFHMCEGLSHYLFDAHFPDNQWQWAILCVSIDCMSFGEIISSSHSWFMFCYLINMFESCQFFTHIGCIFLHVKYIMCEYVLWLLWMSFHFKDSFFNCE